MISNEKLTSRFGSYLISVDLKWIKFHAEIFVTKKTTSERLTHTHTNSTLSSTLSHLVLVNIVNLTMFFHTALFHILFTFNIFAVELFFFFVAIPTLISNAKLSYFSLSLHDISSHIRIMKEKNLNYWFALHYYMDLNLTLYLYHNSTSNLDTKFYIYP